MSTFIYSAWTLIAFDPEDKTQSTMDKNYTLKELNPAHVRLKSKLKNILKFKHKYLQLDDKTQHLKCYRKYV